MTPATRRGVAGLRLAVVNWRDEWHSAAGGAEVYAGEIARGLAARGADVTYLTARGKGQAVAADDRGVRYLRRGGRWTVYIHTLLRLLARRRRLDAVIDCQNGIPFFTPLVLRRRTAVICVVHHVHQDQFGMHFGRVLSAIGRILEGPAGRLVYGRRAVVAVSPGTRTDIRRRLRWRGPIHVVPNGTLSVRPRLEPQRRSATPTIVSVARLVPHKRIDLLIRAAAALRSDIPGLLIHVVGAGPDEGRLRKVVVDLGVGDIVDVHGWVDDATKDSLLDTAWLTVNPTAGEGWGIGVMEAAAHGVPAVAYDVPGMRDSVRAGLTGWLVPEDGDLADVVHGALTILSDTTDAAIIGLACTDWAAQFTWDDSLDRMAAVIDAERAARLRRPARRGDRRHRSSDLVTLAEFDVTDPGAFAIAGQQLRPTDRWGGTGSWPTAHGWVVAAGIDDEELAPVIARIGGSRPRFRVALPTDLLQRVPDSHL